MDKELINIIKDKSVILVVVAEIAVFLVAFKLRII